MILAKKKEKVEEEGEREKKETYVKMELSS